MGLLDSLAQILPYAIPAAAGAALGGPGLAMVGAGGAAQAQNQNLNKQIEIANLLNESQYRNADLGLRRQEIQSNEALRKQSLEQTKQEHSEALGEKRGEFQERLQQHQDDRAYLSTYQQHMLALDQQGKAIQMEMLNARTQAEKDKAHESHINNLRAKIEQAKGLAQRSGKDAIAHRNKWDKYVPFTGKPDDNTFGGMVEDKAFADQLRSMGISRDELNELGVDPEIVNKVYPPASASPPSDKLKSAAKGGGAAATFKTSMPDTPAGHAYHVNGKAYVVKGGVATEVPNG